MSWALDRMSTPPPDRTDSGQSSFAFEDWPPKLTAGKPEVEAEATGRFRKQTVTFFLVLAVGFAVACSVALFYSEKSNAFSLEDCARSCQPRTGVIERKGLSAGPQWRPTPHNLVCTCK